MNYRCVVRAAEGTYVPYSGSSFLLASQAMEGYVEQAREVTIERYVSETWRSIVHYVAGVRHDMC